jgi:hypothetical protein
LQADELIYILFLLFVYNFDIVKKNCIEFIGMFQLQEQKKKKKLSDRVQSLMKEKTWEDLPKVCTTKPFSKEQLDLIEAMSYKY